MIMVFMRRSLRLIAIPFLLIGASVLGHVAWSQRLPPEVQTLEDVLLRLARGNDLGDQPIAFMVGSGSYTSYLAEQRGFCKPDQCDMFAQLNPYHAYGNGWDELIRQGYALGDIQGWASSSGTIVIPRATFRAYGSHFGYLACTVAHEIAHFRRHHIFKSGYYKSYNLKGLPERQKQLELMRFSRQQELEADRDAAAMLLRAGFQGRVCQDELIFLHRSTGDGSATHPESTHPGYEERLKAMREYYDKLEVNPPKTQRSERGRLTYHAEDNLLTFFPESRADIWLTILHFFKGIA